MLQRRFFPLLQRPWISGPILLIMLWLLFAVEQSQAQGVPAGVPGGSAAGAAAAFGGGTGPVGNGGMTYGGSAGSGLDMSHAYVPGQVPTFAPTNYNGANPTMNPGDYGNGGICPLLLAGLFTNTVSGLMNTGIFGKNLERAAAEGPPDYAPNADKKKWGDFGSRMDPKLSGNCQNKFVTKDGKLGVPYGKLTYNDIMEHRDVLIDGQVPGDMEKFCPQFKTFSADAKARFYIFVVMAQANQESTCNPSASAPGISAGKVASGLLGLEPPACNRVGVYVNSNAELLDGSKNLACGVALLANEIKTRGSLTAPTSRGIGGTYWAGLRSDIAARKSSSSAEVAKEGSAAQRTQLTMQDFTECRTGENQANNATKMPTDVPLPPTIVRKPAAKK